MVQLVDGAAAESFMFDADDVPCDPYVFTSLRSRFEAYAERHGRASDAAALAILASMPDTPNAIHRYLLDEQRKAGKYSNVSRLLREALDAIRSHSTLYTRRTCFCLRQVWRTYVETVDDALPTQGGIWTVASATSTWSDYEKAPALLDLIGYAGHEKWRATSPRRVEVLVESPTQLVMTATRGRKLETWTFTHLEQRLADLSHKVRSWESRQRPKAAGSWVRTWPSQMVDLYETWARFNQAEASLEVAREMLESGVGDLGPAALKLALRLSEVFHGGEGSARALVSTAASWAEALSAPGVDVLDAWLENLAGGFDQQLAAAAFAELEELDGATVSRDQGVVARRILDEGWSGTFADLLETSAAVARSAPIAS